MEGYFPVKMKRKDFEDVNDKFSDFSLSSPPRKIRRLDGELPPIVEEEECEIPMRFTQPMLLEQSICCSGGLKIEELPSVNEEKAIVLFKPMETPLRKWPSTFSVSVDPHLISELKNHVLQSGQINPRRLPDDDAVLDECSSLSSSNGCLAVIPWVPPALAAAHGAEFLAQVDAPEMMDAKEAEESTMEIDDGSGGTQTNASEPADHLHQWQQQHCLIPHSLPNNPMNPISLHR